MRDEVLEHGKPALLGTVGVGALAELEGTNSRC